MAVWIAVPYLWAAGIEDQVLVDKQFALNPSEGAARAIPCHSGVISDKTALRLHRRSQYTAAVDRTAEIVRQSRRKVAGRMQDSEIRIEGGKLAAVGGGNVVVAQPILVRRMHIIVARG